MVNVTIYGGVDEIGGNKIIVEDDEEHRICLDFGRRMGYFNRFYDEFLQPRSKAGIRDLIKLGVLPRLDGIYRDFFVNMFHDISPEEVLEEEVIDNASDYWNPGVEGYDGYIEKNDEPFLDAVFVSHAHMDHIQDISYLSPKIPVYCSEKTKLLAQVVTDVGKGGCEYEFYEYDEYEVSLKSDHYKTLFPDSPQIGKKKFDDNPLQEHDHLSIKMTQRKDRSRTRDYRTSKDGETVDIGNMKITSIETDHSVPGSNAFIIEADKNLLYTGDIRFHGDEDKTLEHFLDRIDREIDILLIEGTRVDSRRMLTEKDVEEELTKKFSEVEKLIFVDLPWKDLTRVNTVLRASEANDRTFLIDPRTAYTLFRFHLDHPDEYPDPRELENVAVYKRRQKSMLYSPSDDKKTDAGYLEFWGRNMAKKDENLVRIKERVEQGSATDDEELAWELAVDHIMNGVPAYKIRKSPEDYVLMINFWRMNELFDLGNLEGSYYIKCMCEPFNDEMQIDENKLIGWLDHFHIGYGSTTDEDGNKMIERSHVSGHASRPELKEMVKGLKPKVVIPIHTQNPKEFEKIADEIRQETGHGTEVILPKKGVRYEL